MECNFCNKTFSSKSSLNSHQKTTKYCLKLQGKIDENIIKNFECRFCNKKFTTKQTLTIHTDSCNKKINSEKERDYEEKLKEKEHDCEEKLKEKERDYEEKLKEKERDYEEKLKEKEEKINELKQKNAELQGRLYTLKDDHDIIKEIAKQPKNTTTNNTNTLNITSSLDFDNIEKIKDVIQNDFNINYAINGQKGIARFVKDKLLKDENGKLLYICTDPSRQIFKYKDNKGEIRKDVEAKKLTEYIVDGGIKKKTVDVANEWYTEKSGNIDMERFDMMMDPQQSILNLKDDNNSFKKELASITT